MKEKQKQEEQKVSAREETAKESSSSQETSTNETTEQRKYSTEEMKLMRQNNKMIFLTLVEVANRCRASFADEDTQDYKDALIDNLNSLIASGEVKAKDKAKNMRQIDDLVLRYRQQNNDLAGKMSNMVHGYYNSMTDEGKKNFMGVADTLQLLTIELNRSKNPIQMLSVCQLYNGGFFDAAMAEMEKIKKEKSGLVVEPVGLVDIHGNKL